MGETGALIFALVAFAWGLYQRRAKVQTDGKVVDLEAERSKLEAERSKLETELKVLSMRPPALPAFVIQAAAPITPAPPAPSLETDEQAPDESLG
jgi:hypothetical protein